MSKEVPTTTESVLDYQSLEQRVGDAALAAELLEMFQQCAPEMLGAIQTAVQNGEVANTRDSAHRLKGAALQISARCLTELLQRIESNPRDVSVGLMGDTTQAFKDLTRAIEAR